MLARSLALLALVAAVSCYPPPPILFETILEEGELPIKMEKTLKNQLKNGECKKVIDLSQECQGSFWPPINLGLRALRLSVVDLEPYPMATISGEKLDTVTVTRQAPCRGTATVLLALECRRLRIEAQGRAADGLEGGIWNEDNEAAGLENWWP